eukprot:gene58169-biopygen3295
MHILCILRRRQLANRQRPVANLRCSHSPNAHSITDSVTDGGVHNCDSDILGPHDHAIHISNGNCTTIDDCAHDYNPNDGGAHDH